MSRWSPRRTVTPEEERPGHRLVDRFVTAMPAWAVRHLPEAAADAHRLSLLSAYLRGFTPGLAAAECRVERRCADVPHVVGDVDRDSGGTISSMRSSTSADSSIPSVARWLSTCSMVRGPMIAEVTEGWRVTNATAPPER